MRFLVPGLTLLLFALAAGAAAPPAARAADGAPAAAPVARIAKPSPMMVEIRAALDEERATLATLNERFRTARDEATAQAVQRDIARVKLDTELNVLRVQAKHARLAGHDAVAAYLEGAIRALVAPPVVLPATTRPAPSLHETNPNANAQH